LIAGNTLNAEGATILSNISSLTEKSELSNSMIIKLKHTDIPKICCYQLT